MHDTIRWKLPQVDSPSLPAHEPLLAGAVDLSQQAQVVATAE